MIRFAGCKINLGLDVLSRRADGYHDIETVMFPVKGFYDTVEVIRSTGEGVEFSSSGIAVDCPADKNLCVRAYGAVRARYGIGGVRMHLHKAVPFGAGLGGGSADAVAVIKLLDDVFSLGMGAAGMESVAAELGSDTVFFVCGEPAVARGRGEAIEPIDLSLDGYRLAIIKPQFSVSTAQAYSGVVPAMPIRSAAEIVKGDISSWRAELKNDFEPSVFALHPELGRIKAEFYAQGAIYASMSGSGSAIYGIFDGRPELTGILSKSGIYLL